jgi:[glutamine synthetase] adenylyltransferase / [glutamine synthetase]-adenylyl-L-tyrosine phosphorylase
MKPAKSPVLPGNAKDAFEHRFGFPRTLWPLIDSLTQQLVDPALAKVTLGTVRERAPDEQLALAFLTKLLEQSPVETAEMLRQPQSASDLIFCLGASELLGADLVALGPRWAAVFQEARSTTVPDLLNSIRFDCLNTLPLPDSAEVKGTAATSEYAARITQSLAEFKRRTFLVIAIADLLGLLTVSDTIRAMSRLADECIRAAFTIGTLTLGETARQAGDFCVIALGKLGAEELNLSSDIDLMYIFGGPDDVQHQDGARRLGEAVTGVLAGNCFRVDMRLRPGGRNSPLVISLEASLRFYETLGQTWERAALLRARPVAGAIELGNRLISELRRFIYRSYLDFDTLRQLRAMKRQIEAESRSPDFLRRNIKLGSGGIRELEFIVQALTLIYGGRDPRLRTAQTLAALDRLGTCGYMRRQRTGELRAAYLFLRNVEHKLQVASGLQTHRLPASGAEMQILAARLGFGKRPDAATIFMDTLTVHRTLVANLFREMLVGSEETPSTPATGAAQRAWRDALDPQASAPALQLLGFALPDQSANQLVLLVRGPEHVPMRPRRQELLEALGPRLLDEIGALPDPDLALLNLASFISAVGARTSFLALLEQHPATRRMLLRLFASSSYLSTLFIRHPDMLDTLVRSDLARLRRPLPELERELGELLTASSDFENRLDALRAFGHQEYLRIAIADLAGSLDLDAVQVELTNLAEAQLRQALGLAVAEVSNRYSIPAELRLSIIGLGRLGASEMSYNSDLDLIFVYDLPNETAASGREIASRIMQKLIAVLEARTREGYAYKLDLRLRPSGNSGPLVTSLAGFREYHQQSSAVWERQALVRARVIAGDENLGQALERARQEFVFGKPLSASGVAEIVAMRVRMENEIGIENDRRLNLKQGRGGLVDVEFIAQMMVLRHGHSIMAFHRRNTTGLIRALAETRLLESTTALSLEEDYRFLLRLENRLRIETDQAAWSLPTDDEHLAPVARRMGLEGDNSAARLLYEVEERRSRIRRLFEMLFEREQSAYRDEAT